MAMQRTWSIIVKSRSNVAVLDEYLVAGEDMTAALDMLMAKVPAVQPADLLEVRPVGSVVAGGISKRWQCAPVEEE